MHRAKILIHCDEIKYPMLTDMHTLVKANRVLVLSSDTHLSERMHVACSFLFQFESRLCIISYMYINTYKYLKMES